MFFSWLLSPLENTTAWMAESVDKASRAGGTSGKVERRLYCTPTRSSWEAVEMVTDCSLRAWTRERWVTVAKGIYCSGGHYEGQRPVLLWHGERCRTHAVESPCIFQLIAAPRGGNAVGFVCTHKVRQGLRDRFCREEGTIEVKSYDGLVG